jgi:hypothetical protein
MPVVSLKNFASANTLIYEVEKADGTAEQWKVPPLTAGDEFAVRELQTSQLAQMRGSDDPFLIGKYWAPVVALLVKDPVLDPEALARDYYPQLVRAVGMGILDFFHSGRLPEATETTPTDQPA